MAKNAIPTELNDLMWQITESGDLNAADDFFQRFPLYRPELERRMNLARSYCENHGVRHVSRSDLQTKSPKIVWGIGAGVIACGICGWLILRATHSAPSSNIDPAPSPQHPVSSTLSTQTPANTLPPVGTVVPPVKSQIPLADGDVTDLNAKDPYGLQRPVKSINLKNLPLSAAIQLIATAAKVKITLAPGLKDQPISLQTGQSTIGDLLDGLGSEYGFTVSPQGPGDFILIPITGTN